MSSSAALATQSGTVPDVTNSDTSAPADPAQQCKRLASPTAAPAAKSGAPPVATNAYPSPPHVYVTKLCDVVCVCVRDKVAGVCVCVYVCQTLFQRAVRFLCFAFLYDFICDMVKTGGLPDL